MDNDNDDDINKGDPELFPAWTVSDMVYSLGNDRYVPCGA
jgi:hypothetical protein